MLVQGLDLTPPTPCPSLCQQQLPATGVPITHQRFDQMRDMFDDYVRTRTLHNWKFWVVSSSPGPIAARLRYYAVPRGGRSSQGLGAERN